jgi:hypothetical protein
VLPSVLLHVVVAARPVHTAFNDARHLRGAERRLQKMPDAIVFIDHFAYGYARERPEVERLSAGSRVERSPIQIHAPAPVRAVDNLRSELAEIAVVIVETFGHPLSHL